MLGSPILVSLESPVKYSEKNQLYSESIYPEKSLAISEKWPQFQFQCIPSILFQHPAQFKFEIPVLKCRNAHFFSRKRSKHTATVTTLLAILLSTSAEPGTHGFPIRYMEFSLAPSGKFLIAGWTRILRGRIPTSWKRILVEVEKCICFLASDWV